MLWGCGASSAAHTCSKREHELSCNRCGSVHRPLQCVGIGLPERHRQTDHTNTRETLAGPSRYCFSPTCLHDK